MFLAAGACCIPLSAVESAEASVFDLLYTEAIVIALQVFCPFQVLKYSNCDLIEKRNSAGPSKRGSGLSRRSAGLSTLSYCALSLTCMCLQSNTQFAHAKESTELAKTNTNSVANSRAAAKLTVPQLVAISEQKLNEQQNQPAAKTAINLMRRALWHKEHDDLVKRAGAQGSRLMVFGDSITQYWAANHRENLLKHFNDYRVETYGIAGDTTVDLLWRMNHGEFAGNPAVVVILIGSNDVFRNTTDDAIVENIDQIIQSVALRSPNSNILLLGVLPRATEKVATDMRCVNKAIKLNSLLAARYNNRKTIRFLDVGKKFQNKDGTVNHALMPDYIHPNVQGYDIIAQTMKSSIVDLMSGRKLAVPR